MALGEADEVGAVDDGVEVARQLGTGAEQARRGLGDADELVRHRLGEAAVVLHQRQRRLLA